MRRGLAALLLLAACAQHVDTPKTLAQAEALTTAQNDAALAKLDADCRLTDAGCATLHKLKAEACQRLAAQPDLPARRRRRALDCATGNYNATLAVWDRTRDAAGRPDDVAPILLSLLAARRDLEPDADDAQELNRRLGFRAEALAHERGPAGQAGLVWGAEAALRGVLLAGPTGGCEGLARASELLGRAVPKGTPVAAKAQDVAGAIQDAKGARGCA
jgi:hypothetical protein